MTDYFVEMLNMEIDPVVDPHAEAVQRLRELVEVQGRDGNWNYDDYMLGMFNGMELMLSIMEDRQPVFRNLKPAVVSIPAAPQTTSHPPILGLTHLGQVDHRFGLSAKHY